MPTVNLGKVGMTLKGVYEDEAQYEKLDVVYYDDSTYCAKVSTKGNTPSKEDDTYWQLLVAPNPLATWKPNTKEDEGYVEKGDGHTDSLWATDSEGNPSWVKKEDVATKVETNSKTADGIVTKGQDNLNKVWATDEEGNPAWRNYNYAIVLDSSTWDSDKRNPSQFYRIIAKVKQSMTGSRSVSFIAESAGVPYSYTECFWTTFDSGNIRPSFVYCGLFTGGTDTSNPIKSSLYSLFNSGEGSSDVYLAISYQVANLGKIYISNLYIPPDLDEFEWLWDSNIYYDKSKSGNEDYEFYHYNSIEANVLQADPISATNINGLVPKSGSTAQYSNLILTTNYGAASWRTYKEFGLITSTEVDTKIAEAITAENVPQFVELDHIPTVEEAEPNKFYLVKNEKTNHYDIYALLGDNVELIDDTTVDLTNYTTLTDEQYNALIELLGEE